MATEPKQVTVHCKMCNQPVLVEVTAENLADQKDGILRVMLAHGDPLHAITVYIDRNLRVREIEYPDSFQMDTSRSVSVVEASEIASSLSESMGEPCYQALYAFDEVKEREKTAFVLDKTILRTICESGTICLSVLRQKVAFLEKALGDRIDLFQIETVCERYVQEGLIKRA
ncbi:MAG: hypothetical protein ACFFD6_06305 [Candidatus Thorarchaeota archaeon]